MDRCPNRQRKGLWGPDTPLQGFGTKGTPLPSPDGPPDSNQYVSFIFAQIENTERRSDHHHTGQRKGCWAEDPVPKTCFTETPVRIPRRVVHLGALAFSYDTNRVFFLNKLNQVNKSSSNYPKESTPPRVLREAAGAAGWGSRAGPSPAGAPGPPTAFSTERTLKYLLNRRLKLETFQGKDNHRPRSYSI